MLACMRVCHAVHMVVCVLLWTAFKVQGVCECVCVHVNCMCMHYVFRSRSALTQGCSQPKCDGGASQLSSTVANLYAIRQYGQ